MREPRDYQYKKTTYLLDATSTWDSTTAHKLAVPANKRWRILCITQKNDANQTSAFYYTDALDVVIAQIESQGANTGRTTWPSDDTNEALLGSNEFIMDGGEKISFVAGGAQGAGAYIYVHALEWDV